MSETSYLGHGKIMDMARGIYDEFADRDTDYLAERMHNALLGDLTHDHGYAPDDPVRNSHAWSGVALVLGEKLSELEDGKGLPKSYNLVTHLKRQRDFSEEAFGPGKRVKGVLDHIRKELTEIEKNPSDLEEWIDVALLAFDGAWRQGYTPLEIAEAFERKLRKNMVREWPDWQRVDPDRAIEHIR
jgi:hypothetical protein